MKISLRNKLFLGMSGLIVLFVALSLLLTSQFLEKYYIQEKKVQLSEIAQRVEQIYQGDPEAISLELEQIERTRGSQMLLFDSSLNVKYAQQKNFPKGAQLAPGEPPVFPLPPNGGKEGANRLALLKQHIPQLAQEPMITIQSFDPRLNSLFLVTFEKLRNGDYLVVDTPLVPIRESAQIASRFFLAAGLLTIILGSLAVFFLSRRFTAPILELNRIARKMAKLDFDHSFTGTSRDEIGQLGQSINSLSSQLSQSIKELQEANAKLQEDIERERRVDEMRKEFVSSVSHELKTPIALIKGYAEGLKENIYEDEANKEFYCEVILDESNKMGDLVKDLLDLSRIESGFFQLEKESLDGVGLIRQVAEKFSPLFGEKGIACSQDLPFEAEVLADPLRLEQILTNFLNNAIQHTDGARKIEIRLFPVEEKYRLEVYNSGSSIPEESLEHLWKSFYKVDKARKRADGGTGLGLSIVRAIQELAGNRYGVENVEGGVTFWAEVDRG